MSLMTEVAPVRAVTIDGRRMAAVVVAAIAINLLVYGVGSMAGATWIVNGQAVAWFMVPVATAVAMGVGLAITSILARRWAPTLSVMAWVGLVFAVATAAAPLLTSDDATTGWALATMHVTTGVLWFVAIRPRHVTSAG